MYQSNTEKLEVKTTAEFKDVNAKMTADFKELNAKMTADFKAVNAKIDKLSEIVFEMNGKLSVRYFMFCLPTDFRCSSQLSSWTQCPRTSLQALPNNKRYISHLKPFRATSCGRSAPGGTRVEQNPRNLFII
jgi:hypothetical protein